MTTKEYLSVFQLDSAPLITAKDKTMSQESWSCIGGPLRGKTLTLDSPRTLTFTIDDWTGYYREGATGLIWVPVAPNKIQKQEGSDE